MNWAGHKAVITMLIARIMKSPGSTGKRQTRPCWNLPAKLIRLRNEHSVFSRKYWFRGDKVAEGEAEDIAWFLPDGQQMADEHWSEGFAKSVAVYLKRQRTPCR